MPDPARLAIDAVNHGDDHVLKLTEACIRHHERTGDPVALFAAEAFLTRLAPTW